MNYQEALGWLEDLNSFGIQLGLERIKYLVELLGHPEQRYRTIHVTGTNGKGSVSSMLAAAFSGAKIRTALYTSPHLSSYTERMQVDGQEISQQDFARTLTIVRQAVERMTAEGKESPTQFEVLTAQAFLWFFEQKVEYAVIEVGLGGLLDSTNVIVPVLSIITNVTMEHADRCGGTLEGVACHKAGIIKENVPVVTAAAGLPLAILRQTALDKQAPLCAAGEDFSASFQGMVENRQALVFTAKAKGMQRWPYELSLLGRYQIENSGLVIMAFLWLREKEPRLCLEALRAALAHAAWPGRFELLRLEGKNILLDGAHNPAGIRVLRESLEAYYSGKGYVFLLGILQDKDIDAMLRCLVQREDSVVVTAPVSARAAAPTALAARVEAREVRAEYDLAKALELALQMTGKEGLLVAAGSLYLIGALRELIEQRGGKGLWW